MAVAVVLELEQPDLAAPTLRSPRSVMLVTAYAQPLKTHRLAGGQFDVQLVPTRPVPVTPYENWHSISMIRSSQALDSAVAAWKKH